MTWQGIRSMLPICPVLDSFRFGDHSSSASDAIYHLGQLVPTDAGLFHRPELEVKYGASAQNIIDTASRCSADLIVLGVRKGDVFGVATHVERTIAHEVVVNAPCPVLTVCG